MSAFSGAAFAGTALVIAAPSAAGANPDAELFAVLAEFDALEQQIFPQPGPARSLRRQIWEVRAAPLLERRRALLDRPVRHARRTRSKASGHASARSCSMTTGFMPELETQARKATGLTEMQLALFRDLAGEHAA